MNADIVTKLQSHRGYQGWRIRPYPLNPAVWLAETYTFLGHGNRKGWRALRDEKRGDYRTFPTSEGDLLITSFTPLGSPNWQTGGVQTG